MSLDYILGFKFITEFPSSSSFTVLLYVPGVNRENAYAAFLETVFEGAGVGSGPLADVKGRPSYSIGVNGKRGRELRQPLAQKTFTIALKCNDVARHSSNVILCI